MGFSSLTRDQVKPISPALEGGLLTTGPPGENHPTPTNSYFLWMYIILNIQKPKFVASNPITSWQIEGETVETVTDFIFLGCRITSDVDCSHEIKRHLLLGRKTMTNLDSISQSRDITDKGPSAVVFPGLMYGYESWTIKKAEHWKIDAWTVVLEKTLESSLDCKEIKPVNRKGNQTWIFIGRTDAEAETAILWPPNTKNWLIGKYSDAGKDWRQEEKGTTKDEMVGWHHWLDGHEFEQALWVGDGQGSLACCSPWSHKELDTTEWLNWTEYMNAFPHQKTWSMCVKSLWQPHPPNCIPLSRVLMCVQFGGWISRHHSLYLPMYVLTKNILNVCIRSISICYYF